MNIRMKQVSVYSPTEGGAHPLLKDMHAEFASGTLTLIAGHTGSGKSTLLHTLAGLIPLGKGSITYGDVPLWTSTTRVHDTLMRDIGIAFQYPERQLFAECVRKEFEYSFRPFRWTKADKLRATHDALAAFGLSQDVLDEPVLTLSEGTKRKIALATTIATKPQWLLLDEPTSGMDPVSTEPLLEILRSHRQAGGGVIVASHDLDTFLPVADRVIILQTGAIEADLTPQRCCAKPELLLQTGIGWPAQVEIIAALRAVGLSIGGCPLTPEQTAAAIIERLAHKTAESARNCQNANASEPVVQTENKAATNATSTIMEVSHGSVPFRGTDYKPLPGMQRELLRGRSPSGESACTAQAARADKRQESLFTRLDPIAKWIFYVCVSTGILLQQSWPGVLLALAVSLPLVLGSRTNLRLIGKGVKFFAFFIVVSGAISAMEVGFAPFDIEFRVSPALLTIRQLLRFLLVMALGIVFMATTSERRMHRGLERALSRLDRFHIPTKLVTFSAALMLRFIPILQLETERMSLIAKARGKANVKPGSIRLRDVHVFLIPLLLSMMKQAEDLALALEARGYKVRSAVHIDGGAFEFKAPDKLAIAFGVVLLTVFVLSRIYL